MEVGLHPMAAIAGAVNEASDLRKPARAAAVVLAAHGERGGARVNCALLSHAAALSRSGRYAAVAAGVLNGEPSLEAALEAVRSAAADDLLVYPVFMSDGYFVRRVLVPRIAAAAGPSARTLAPLGLDPRLPPLMMREALAAAARAGFDAASARLLVVGHGSSSRPNGASARATRRAAQLIAAFADISVAFLEEPPFLTEVLADGSRPTVVLGFFSGEGLHALEDVPAAVAALAANAVYTGPIGALPEIADIIARAVDAAASPPA